MQENFIPQSSLKSLISAEEVPNNQAMNQASDSSVVMASFDTFHAAPDHRSKTSEKEQDYQAGFAAGKAEAAGVYETTIKVMETTLESLKTGFQTQVAEIEESHSRLILKCLEAVLPSLSEHILISELQKTLLETSGQNLGTGASIRLHPNNDVAKTFLSNQSEGMISIIEDNTQPEMGVTVSWENSRTEIDPVGVAQHCLSLLGGQAVGTVMKTEIDHKTLGHTHD